MELRKAMPTGFARSVGTKGRAPLLAEGQCQQMGLPAPWHLPLQCGAQIREEFFWNHEGQEVFKHSSSTCILLCNVFTIFIALHLFINIIDVQVESIREYVEI